jgi:hypothetical protein
MRMISISTWVLGAALALSATACGGTSNDPRPEPPSADEGGSGLDLGSCEDIVEAFEFRAIESFEGGSVQDSMERDVGWWVSTDGTNNYEYQPYDAYDVDNHRVNANFLPTLPEEGDASAAPALLGDAACEPSAGYMKLESREPGFSDWGMTFGANFKNELLDGGDWDGIAFWARHGEGSAVTSFNATLPDKYTSNQAAADMVQHYECRDGLEVENLCDPFGRGIAVTDEWRFYLLPFAQLSQQGFGKASPLGMLDVQEILGMSFQIGAGTWEIWVDEIVYYRER